MTDWLASARDGVRIVQSAATKQKIGNGVKVLKSYYHARKTGNPIMTGLPISIAIEPTTSCNLRCPQCPSGLRSFTRPTGMLQGDLYKQLIDDLSPTLAYLILYFQGEPYLNKEFLEMVSYASKKKIYTATSTNAHFLDEESARKTIESGLGRILISIDGTTQESYSHYRIGGKLDKVIEGTENLLKWRTKLKAINPRIIWQFVVFKHNEDEIKDIKNLAKELNVDSLWIKTAQVYDNTNAEDWVPENNQLSRYVYENGIYKIKNKLLNHCWKMWHSCVITWDGLVVPCCFDKDAKHLLGDLKASTFNDIWFGEKYTAFRKQLLSGRKNIDICTNCSEGTKVWG